MLALTSVLCGVAAVMVLPMVCGCPYLGVFPLAGAVVSLVTGYRGLSKAPYASDPDRATTLGKLGMALGGVTLVVIVLVTVALSAVLLLTES